MSGTGSDPFAPGSPGDEDDLQSELDAWDRDFDALHEDPVAPRATTVPTSSALDADAFTDEEPTRAMQVPRSLIESPRRSRS